MTEKIVYFIIGGIASGKSTYTKSNPLFKDMPILDMDNLILEYGNGVYTEEASDKAKPEFESLILSTFL